jgi:hypothetical protein
MSEPEPVTIGNSMPNNNANTQRSSLSSGELAL